MKYAAAIFVLILIGVFFVLLPDASAQCAMCKAVVESDQGGEFSRGINQGILYLMGIPYLLLVAGAIYFFRKPISEKLKGLKR